MHRDRLKLLADFLPTVPADAFNIGSWKCGTTACAMGWACEIPEFRALGLEMQITSPMFENDTEIVGIPVFNGHSNFRAASAFFDISLEDASMFFSRDAYTDDEEGHVTATDVAERIQRYLDEV